MKPKVSTDAEREPTLAELMDPVALEQRLAEARARRAVAVARRAPDGAARPPSVMAPDRRVPSLGHLAATRGRLPAGAAAALGRRSSTFAAGLAAGLAAAGLATLVSGRAPLPPDVWIETAAVSVPVMAERPAVAGPSAMVRVGRPGPLLALAAAAPAGDLGSLRPEPRPARAGPPPQPPRLATRSARNRPVAAAPPEVVVDIIGDLNLATLGRAAATLGVRERVELPGVTLSLDRRGLRLKPHKVRRRRRGND